MNKSLAIAAIAALTQAAKLKTRFEEDALPNLTVQPKDHEVQTTVADPFSNTVDISHSEQVISEVPASEEDNTVQTTNTIENSPSNNSGDSTDESAVFIGDVSNHGEITEIMEGSSMGTWEDGCYYNTGYGEYDAGLLPYQPEYDFLHPECQDTYNDYCYDSSYSNTDYTYSNSGCNDWNTQNLACGPQASSGSWNNNCQPQSNWNNNCAPPQSNWNQNTFCAPQAPATNWNNNCQPQSNWNNNCAPQRTTNFRSNGSTFSGQYDSSFQSQQNYGPSGFGGGYGGPSGFGGGYGGDLGFGGGCGPSGFGGGYGGALGYGGGCGPSGFGGGYGGALGCGYGGGYGGGYGCYDGGYGACGLGGGYGGYCGGYGGYCDPYSSYGGCYGGYGGGLGGYGGYGGIGFGYGGGPSLIYIDDDEDCGYDYKKKDKDCKKKSKKWDDCDDHHDDCDRDYDRGCSGSSW